MSISWQLTISLMKWAQMSICFMHECDWGSCVQATVPWQLQYNSVACIWGNPSSKNSNCCQRIWHALCEQAMYSALQDDNATTTYCLELQAMLLPPHSMRKLDMLLHPSNIAQSKLANALNKGKGLGKLP
jgi:hypothetical protein